MRRFFLTVGLLLMAMPARAAIDDTFEGRGVHAVLTYCVPAMNSGEDAAAIAEREKLDEVEPVEAAPILKGKPGRVFALPMVGAGAMLETFGDAKGAACEVSLQQVDAKELTRRVTHWFDPRSSPFHMTRNDRISDAATVKQFEGKAGGSVIRLTVFISDMPVADGPQAEMSMGRADND